jgi:ribosomal protein S18 acetylase RimI-like enzyme
VQRPLVFVTAEEASLDDFLSVSKSSPYHEQLRAYAEALIRDGATKAGWCVVGLASEGPVARAAFWAPPDERAPTDLVLIDGDWTDPHLADVRALLAHLHDVAPELSARALWHHVDSPPVAPQYQEHDSARVRLFEETGYELQRDGLRWLYSTATADEPVEPTSLLFRSLDEVGEDRFIEAMASTYESTPDSILTRHIQDRGLRGAARSDFLDYQEMDYLPHWWELAYTHEGAVAGVIMGARTTTSPVVAYVGVTPPQRGRGLAAELVRRATAQLVADGADEIRGDCDRDNVAMVKAFERAGYEQFARRRSYCLPLPA